MKKPVIYFLKMLSILLPLPCLFLPLLREAPEAPETPQAPVPITEIPPLSMPPCNCTLTQGNLVLPLPFMIGNTSAVNFYSYGIPLTVSANTGLETSENLLFMMYEDASTGNTSFIFIFDEPNDGTGGNADITFSCLPGGAGVDLGDEPGEFAGSPPVITGSFNWAECCTDGGIIGGVGCGDNFTIDLNINSGIDIISIVSGSPSSPNYVAVPQTNCPMVVNCQSTACCEAFDYNATTQNANCDDSGDGGIDLTTDCAADPTFIWSNGATTEDLFGVNPGTYSVTISDINGCTQSDSYVVDAISPNPEPSINGPTEFCTGETVDLSVSSFYSNYLWSSGSTDNFILVTTPGTYSVTVTNSNGCTGTTSITLTEYAIPVAEIMGPTSMCLLNDTISLDAGPGFDSYQWSTGESSQTINVTEPGGYLVTVTNGSGCSAFDITFIEPIPNPTPEITGPSSICSGNTITLDAGPGFNSYLWSNGETTQTIATSSEDTYIVTVTNSGGCEGIDTLELVENPVDSILLFQTSCNPADTGVFVQQFVNQYGCDSVEILTVSFNESDSVFLFNQSCNPLDTGIFIQNFTNQYGCDSLEIETVTLLPTNSIFFMDSSCSPLDTGTVVQLLTNQFGCDSLVTTTTLLLPSDTVQLFENSCDPANAGVTEELLVNVVGCDSLVITTTAYALADTTYLFDTTCDEMITGVSENLYIGTDGCDSLVISTVELLLSDTTYLEAFTCDINQAGEAEELFSNQDGCDSLIITNTTFIPIDTTLNFNTSCDPSEAGIFEETLSNSFGCDSLLITTVTLLPTDTTALFQTSCDPNQSGIEEVLLMNQYGCDSLVVISTSYSEADSTQVFDTTCDPTNAGEFVEFLTSTDGCDSVVTTTITLLPSDTVQVTTQSCDPANVGTFEELLSNQFGCDSLVVITVDLLPSDTTLLLANTCDIGQPSQTEEILPNQYGCDSLIVTSFTFIPPDTTLLFSETCNPDEAGTAEVYLQNIFGCDSLVITTTALLPSDTIILQASSCDPNQVGTTEELMTNTYGCDSLVIINTAQLPVDTTWFLFETCLPTDTGLVFNVLVNQYGCDSLVLEQTDLLPFSECQLNALILGDTIGCQETGGDLWLTFFNGTSPYQYTWTDQSGNMGSGIFDQIGLPQQVAGLPPGSYTFEIVDVEGLVTTLSADIFQPDPLQILLQINSDFNGYGISCYGASDGAASVEVLDGGLLPYSYNWSNGSQTGQVDGLEAGLYSVTVLDATSCLATESILLESPDSLQFNLSVAQPECFDEEMGAIAISQVEGGIGPYQFALNGNNWQSDILFENLASGSYLIEVEDANDCMASSYAFINSLTQLIVDLGPDTILQYGDSMELRPLTNLPFAFLDSIYWGGLDCPGCPDVTVTPVAASNYSVTIVDSLGCEASDELNIAVRKDFKYYIPNAFSPNQDGINDHFVIYSGKHVVKIRELQVFDRWGEPVFTFFNFPPNDPAYGWDGTHRGEQMNPAVFAFFAVLEFVDSSTQLVKGDIMLIR